VFALNGFGLSTWIARLPAVRDELALRPAQVGLILFMGSIGSTLALPLSGWVIERIGIRRTVMAAASLTAAFLSVAAALVTAGQPAGVALALFVAFAAVAGWDVAMNLEGTVVERAVGRAIMPRFHAGFSFGTVAGALLGAATARLGVPLQIHIPVVMVLAAGAAAYCVRWFITDPPEVHEHPHAKPSSFAVWREPRTLLVGVVVLAAGLTEGSANDWVALAVVDGFDQPNSVGALAFALFVTFMTLMRLLGTGLLERYGRVTILRLCTVLAVVGLLLFALAPFLPLALAGVALWGLGAAIGFPVGMSAASDEPARAAARLSVVSTIGYTAFMAGPPLIGLLAEQFGYRGALLFVVLPLVVSLTLIPATRPLAARPVPTAMEG